LAFNASCTVSHLLANRHRSSTRYPEGLPDDPDMEICRCPPPQWANATQVLKSCWEIITPSAQLALLDAETRRDVDGAGTFDFGVQRTFSTAEAVLWTERHGPCFAARVAAAIGGLETSKRIDARMGFLRNEAKSVKYAQCTTKSIENLLKSPAFSKRPKLTRKGTKAAAAEEAEEAAAAAFALEFGELNRKAAEFEANADDFAIERAREAPRGTPCARAGSPPCNLASCSAAWISPNKTLPSARSPQEKG